MSIVRVGLSEAKDFAEGYEAIFGKKEQPAEAATEKPEVSAAPKAEESGRQEAPRG